MCSTASHIYVFVRVYTLCLVLRNGPTCRVGDANPRRTSRVWHPSQCSFNSGGQLRRSCLNLKLVRHMCGVLVRLMGSRPLGCHSQASLAARVGSLAPRGRARLLLCAGLLFESTPDPGPPLRLSCCQGWQLYRRCACMVHVMQLSLWPCVVWSSWCLLIVQLAYEPAGDSNPRQECRYHVVYGLRASRGFEPPAGQMNLACFSAGLGTVIFQIAYNITGWLPLVWEMTPVDWGFMVGLLFIVLLSSWLRLI